LVDDSTPNDRRVLEALDRRAKLDAVNLAVGILDFLLTHDLRLYLDVLAAGIVGAGYEDSFSRIVVLLADKTEAALRNVLALGNLNASRIVPNLHGKLKGNVAMPSKAKIVGRVACRRLAARLRFLVLPCISPRGHLPAGLTRPAQDAGCLQNVDLDQRNVERRGGLAPTTLQESTERGRLTLRSARKSNSPEVHGGIQALYSAGSAFDGILRNRSEHAEHTAILGEGRHGTGHAKISLPTVDNIEHVDGLTSGEQAGDPNTASVAVEVDRSRLTSVGPALAVDTVDSKRNAKLNFLGTTFVLGHQLFSADRLLSDVT
jgi:hypothetical protein